MRARRLPALLALLLAACGGPRETWRPTESSRYDRLAEDDAIRFDGACRSLERGELQRAQEQLADLAARHPEHVAIGLWLQEAELRRLRAGGLAEEQALEAVRARWSAAAEAAPAPSALVLAARVAPDAERALALLQRALELDPLCAWAWYARANVLMRPRRWSEAREAIASALSADPGHLRARLLEAAMLARAGDASRAREAYELWLEHAEREPTLDRRMVSEARIDLALLEVIDGEPRAARERLEELGPLADDPAGEARRLLVLAACLQALGEPREALDAVRRAEAAAPGNRLAHVQEALLLERWLGDPDAAAAAWREVLELARDEADLSALLESMRARVHVERAEREGRVPEAAEGRP